MSSREAERLAIVEQNLADVAPFVEAMGLAGYDPVEISALLERGVAGKEVVPLLTEWLPKVRMPDVKSTLVRALTMRCARSAAPVLLAELRRLDEPNCELGWAICRALEVMADDALADDIISIALDRRFRGARGRCVFALAKLKRRPGVLQILIDLLSDPDVDLDALYVLGRLRCKEARPAIEALLKHPTPLVRQRAQEALFRIAQPPPERKRK